MRTSITWDVALEDVTSSLYVEKAAAVKADLIRLHMRVFVKVEVQL